MAHKRLIILALLGVSIGLGITLSLYKFQEPKGTVYKETSNSISDSNQKIGGDFTLIDQNGNSRSTEEFRGKILLIYFTPVRWLLLGLDLLHTFSYFTP